MISRYMPFLPALLIKRRPVELTFFITAACNFRCRHCFNWRAIESTDTAAELTLEEIRTLARTMPRLLRIAFSGGEPFLRRDLPPVCRAFHDAMRVPFISIPTNASMPDRIAEVAAEIAAACPRSFVSISLSVDETGKARDDVVGRSGTWESLLETARRLKMLQQRHANLGLGVITTQTPRNQHRLDQIYDTVQQEIAPDNFGFNIARMDAKEKGETQSDYGIYRRFTRRLVSDRRSSRFRFALSGIFSAKKAVVFDHILRSDGGRRYISPCYSGRLRVVINECGDVFPCETMQFCEKNGEWRMGNLRDFGGDFRKLFDSPRAREIRQRIRATRCRCAHECDLETNILFNPFYLPRVLVRAVVGGLSGGKRAEKK